MAVDKDVEWLIKHLEDDAEACSAVNGERDASTMEARRAEVTVKRLARWTATIKQLLEGRDIIDADEIRELLK